VSGAVLDPPAPAARGRATAPTPLAEAPTVHARLAERAGWSLCALLVVFWGLRLWGGSVVVGWMNAASVALTLAGLLAFWGVWALPRSLNQLEQGALLGLLGAGVAGWGYLHVFVQPAYGTDAMAFTQYAADLVLQGRNPYVESMAPSLQHYLVPTIFRTFLLDGTLVDSVSYPALGFLLYVPALLLGLQMQAAVFTNLAMWIAAFLLLWRLLPRGLGWTAGIMMSFITYAAFVVGGATDALFMPFVFVALWRWDRYGAPDEPGLARWIGPIALGLAMSVKQGPWFLLPFLLVGLALESRGRGASLLWQPIRYLAVVTGVFLAVNGRFIAADPVAWAHQVSVPLLSPMVASGQGLVNLSLFGRLGGVLLYYKIAGVLALAATLVAFAVFYPRLKRAWVPLLGLVFFWPARSFATYLIDLAPAAVLAATTVRPPAVLGWRRMRPIGIVVVLALVAGLAAAAALALTAAPPLRISIVGTHSTGQRASIDGLRVRVTNTSDRPLEPHFTVMKDAYLTTFWYALSKRGRERFVVPPHATRTVRLRAPNVDSMPALEGGFVLEAFTSDPQTVTASRMSPPPPEWLVLRPDAVDRPVRAGRTVPVAVPLVGRLGNPVRRTGVVVSLSQVVYGQHALIPGQASINGMPEGATPVRTRTDANGVASFNVRGVQAQSDPVFFQAWIAPPDGVPHGYSNLLSVQFLPELPS
jgi:uncharacterized membrane protein